MKPRLVPVGLLLSLLLAACVREQPQVIVITATFPSEPQVLVPAGSTPLPATTNPVQPPAAPVIVPTPDAVLPVVSAATATEHVVQAGDTLSRIAQQYGLSMEALMQANALTNPDVLFVGQVLTLPQTPAQLSPGFKIIPDSRLVRGPGSREFDIAGFIAAQPGYIITATDVVTTRLANGAGFDLALTAAQVVERVALEYSVDPRLLLALLEYRAGWLSNPQPDGTRPTHPLIAPENSLDFDRSGLYKQLAWAANELNRGYYGWKSRGLQVIELVDGTRLSFAPGLNAGSISVQYLLSRFNTLPAWQMDVSADGLYRTYLAYFGDPFVNAVEPLVPITIEQPPLTLPFAAGEIWYYTGGPHGGWGAGSAWAAVDFAPPDDITAVASMCYTSQYAVRALAPGVIARSGDGAVLLDIDGDGDEATGWTILYLHLANLIPAGQRVLTGDIVGQAACAGGFSTATHIHVGRRFNGEWLPADCQQCRPGHERPPFVMSGWQVTGLAGQEYQGFLQSAAGTVIADQGRTNPANRISWSSP
ncbi:MAG: LysM peptidoglycan-binding domain-containing protein [Anaerolineae bacterium]|nr:LysM peptidoglycan-binding domain-containing protein [Anaerolineae bacterium]